MMVLLQSYFRQGKGLLRRLAGKPGVLGAVTGGGYLLMGLLLSAASLGNCPQPFVLALLCAAPPGWPVLLVALGGTGGYLLFWGFAGSQGLAWIFLGLLASAVFAGRAVTRQTPLLMPALAGMMVAVSGTVFQLWLEDTAHLWMYFLRIFLAAGCTHMFALAWEGQDAVAGWLAQGVGVLALAQVAPWPWLDLGYLAAAALSGVGAFPGVALAGIALDLSGVTRIPMTMVLCFAYLLRLLPRYPRWAAGFGAAVVYLPISALWGVWDWTPVPMLLVGGLVSLALPSPTPVNRRRGSTGVAQVRLEVAAEVLAQTEQLLLEAVEEPVDEKALIALAAERACAGCSCRKTCRDRENAPEIPAALLHQPLLTEKDIPIVCRRSGRLLAELRRGQDQLRSIRGERRRLAESRGAVIQQYRFLSEYLRDLADQVAAPGGNCVLRFRQEISATTAGKEPDNGDKCMWFAGSGGKYYVLLCDGMGTGMGASRDGETAGQMLRQMLQCGFPAEYALGSLNSLCALRGRAGAVTVDLAELDLATGRAILFKQGAAPSYLLHHGVAEKIGTATPPPGLSVTENPSGVERLSLRRGEILVLLSDGVSGEEALRRAGEPKSVSLGELADRILDDGRGDGEDDATVAVVRLCPVTTATQ